MRTLLICVLTSILWSSTAFSQTQEQLQQKVANLESKMIILEDYLRVNLEKLQKNNKQQQKKILELEQQNQILKKRLQQLEKLVFSSQADNKLAHSAGSDSDKQKAKQQSQNIQNPASYTNETVKKMLTHYPQQTSSEKLAAVVKLNELSHPDAVRALILYSQEQEKYLKLLAIKALAKKKSQRALWPLFRLLRSSDPEIYLASHEALKQITQTQPTFPASSSMREKSLLREKWQEIIGNLTKE